MDKDTLINACIELISENGRPLSMLEDSGFKKFLDPLMKAIEPGIFLNYIIFTFITIYNVL